MVQGGGELMEAWHDHIGIVLMIGLTLLIVGIGMVIKAKTSPAPWPQSSKQWVSLKSVLNSSLPLDRWLLAASVGCFCLAHLWFSWKEGSVIDQDSFFSSVEWGPETIAQEPSPLVSQVLQADEGRYLVYSEGKPAPILSYYFFWAPKEGNGKALFHRPDVCMPGAGWQQQGDAIISYGTLNGREVKVHQFQFLRGNSPAQLYWICFIDGDSISFAGGAHSHLQLSFVPQFIRLGKRIFSVEVFGLMVQGDSKARTDITEVFNAQPGLEFVLK
ncbi:MAG: exosortase-associated EpsI family protein [Verrucomicrobiota bacterium]